jgi:hypothetical protein
MTQGNLWDRLTREPVYLDQTTRVLEIDPDEVTRFYEPLARRVLGLERPGGRAVVAVAGPPGCGKTAFATTLTAVLNAIEGRDAGVMVGLDGWHFPNSYLDSHTVEHDGCAIPLRKIKGAPETYDQARVRSFMASVHRHGRMAYPVYSREVHDPIPDAGAIEEWQTTVVLEGNYWLLSEPPWSEYWPLFDLRVFLEADPETLVAGLRERHVRGGKDTEFVAQHVRSVDFPNIDRVLLHRGPADVTVRKTDGRTIAALEWAR